MGIAQKICYRADPQCKRNGRKWSKILVCSLYDIIRKMWFHRNSVVHDKVCKTVSKQKQERLDEQIDNEFNLGNTDLQPCDKEFLVLSKKR